MHKKTNQNKGRSMIEMLGVLAIIGVLSIAGISGYKMAINKHRANNVLHDASLTLVDIGNLEPAPTAWKAVRFTPDSGFDFYGMRTTQGVDLVKVEGVPSAVCEVLLEYKDGADISEIYSDDAATTELTECADNQLMVFAYGSGNASETELACSKKKKLCKSPMFFNSETCECYMDTSSCDDADCSEGFLCMDITEGVVFSYFYQGAHRICCPEDTKPVRKINSSDYICVLEDDVVHLVAPEGKGEADCPIGSNSLAWNGLDFVCCGKGTHATVIPSRSDSLCCDEGVVSAVDRTGSFSDYACCPRGYVEENGTCVEPDESCLIIDSAITCCSSTQTPYCSNYDSYDINGECIRAKCGGTECTPAKIDAIGVCCPSDGTAYCSEYNADGTCSEASCCNGAITKFDNVAICCPFDGTTSCSEYNADGTCRDASCCSDFDGLEVCCSSEETPYCYEYNTDGTCKSASCYWGTCTPYKRDSKYGDCCEGAVTKIDDVAACCSSEETPYCYEYNTDGTCKSASCYWGTCTPYKRDSKYGDCCEGAVTKIDDIVVCCFSGETAYCSEYNTDGTCKSASCNWGTCTQARFDVQGVCCSSEETAYCYEYNTDGTCKSASCNWGTCTQARFDTKGVCCSSEETPYCSGYETDGSCKYASCTWGTCTPYKRDSENGSCCEDGWTLTKFDDVAACCSSDETPYCYEYNTDGTCKSASCTWGTCTQARFDIRGVCCSSDETPYCSDDPDGTCKSANCCNESVQTLTKFDDVAACCSSGYSSYCSVYNADGTCKNAGCAISGCTVTRMDNGAACCTSDETPYCSENPNGVCKNAACCNESVKTLTKFDDVAVCCSSGYTPYCSEYNTDGTCKKAACKSGTCTPAKMDDINGGCCPSNQTAYCWIYNSDATCGYPQCNSGSCTPYCWIHNSDGTCSTGSCGKVGCKVRCVTRHSNGECNVAYCG